jgi:hypothetical protein
MAVTYTSTATVTQANKHIAYERLYTLLCHLESFGVDLLSVVVNGDKTVSITLTGAVPADQLAHVGLQ